MVDGIGGSLAPMVPFMTGQFRDSAAGKAFFEFVRYKGFRSAGGAPAVGSRAGFSESDNCRFNRCRQVLDGGSDALASSSFVPAFRKATGSDGVQTWPLNSTYFASTETAQWIANKYGSGEVVEVPFGGVGGIFTASANEYHIKLADGGLVNAGILAGYYERNPPDQFPGLADKLIRAQLGLA